MKNICQKIIGIMIVFILLLNTNLSIAVTQEEINKQKNQQTQISNQLDDAEQKQKEIEAKKTQTMKQVESISSQIDNYESQIDELDSQIESANKKIKESEEKLKETQENYDKQKDMIEKRMVAVYEAGDTSYLDFLLSSSSLTDFISNYYLVTELTEIDMNLLEGIEKQKQEIEQAKKEIENSKEQLTTAKTSKENTANQLKSAKSEKSKYVEQLSEEEKELEKEIQELKQANIRIANEIKAAEIKYQQQLEELKNNSSGSSSGGFSRPTSGPITAYAYYSSGKFHGAIDYGVSPGTPVYAAADGVVMSTANLSNSYGTYVVIRHVNGLQSYYAHGTYGSIVVSPGQMVKKGQLIMKSGNTGNSSGPHLHFELRKSPYNYNGYATGYGQDSRVNPLAYLN